MSFSLKSKTIATVAFAAVAIALVLFYGLVDAESGLMPRCPVKALSGWECPGCGSQRLFHSLLRGNFAEAWSYNPFVFVMTPVVALVIASDIWRKQFPRLHRVMTSPAMIVAILIATIVWTVARNVLKV